MRLKRFSEWLLSCLLVFASPGAAIAKLVTANPANFNAALAKLTPGDTLQLEGLFTNRIILQNRDFGGVRADASRATFQDGLRLNNVKNITFDGGTYGSRSTDTSDIYVVRVDNGSNLSFANATVLGTGRTSGYGIVATNTPYLTVRDSVFDGLNTGVRAHSSPDSLIVRNNIVNSRFDGINVTSSQRVIVANNSCTNFDVFSGAHPDCVQLWTDPGKSLQSDIYVLDNFARGNMQGFSSFTPYSNSGTRLVFSGNYGIIDYVWGIACEGCTSSLFKDNVLIASPYAKWMVAVAARNGSDNAFSNNLLYDFRSVSVDKMNDILPPRLWSSIVPVIAGQVGSMYDDRSYARAEMQRAEAPLPEPATWLLMFVGFALLGRQLRQQERQRRVLA